MGEVVAVPAEGAPEYEKRMKLRYAGPCRICGTVIAAGVAAVYEKDTKTVRCLKCNPAEVGVLETAQPIELGLQPGAPDRDAVASPATAVPVAEPLPPAPAAAGASARREYERRRAKDEAAIREKWGRLGGIAVALADERQSTKAWDVGAVGEERLGRMLDAIAADGFAVLHDRRIPRTKANIDHMVITRSGIWVVDAKRYKGRPDLRIEGGIIRPRTEKLTVGGRDCTKLVEGVLKQAALVRDLVGADVRITPTLCFVESDWPLFGGSFTTRGVQVLWPKKLRKSIIAGVDGPHDVDGLRERIAAHFPAA